MPKPAAARLKPKPAAQDSADTAQQDDPQDTRLDDNNHEDVEPEATGQTTADGGEEKEEPTVVFTDFASI